MQKKYRSGEISNIPCTNIKGNDVLLWAVAGDRIQVAGGSVQPYRAAVFHYHIIKLSQLVPTLVGISTLLIRFFHLVQQTFQLFNMLPIHFVYEPAVEEIAAYSDHRTHGYKEYKKPVVGDSGGNRHL